MSKELLLEIGMEPLPARFLIASLEQLRAKLEEGLKENRLAFKSSQVYGTPRRMAVLIEGVAEKSEVLKKQVQGPPARLLKDEKGQWTKEAAGFAAKNGLTPEDLEIVKTPKGDFLLANVVIAGEQTPAICSRIFPQVIASLQFPKSMEWESSRLRFARPIRSFTALYGKKIIPFKLAGISSGRGVSGLASKAAKPAALSEAAAYPKTLRTLLVQADIEERRKILLKGLEQTAKHLAAKADLDDALIDETVCITEHPVAVEGFFAEKYLALPAPLLSVVLKKQLKFFPLKDQSGRLKASFIGVRDGISEGQALVREGYERVLTARLSDAAFFIERDKKGSLESKLPLLEKLGYQKDLGAMSQKAERVLKISQWIVAALGPERAVNEEAASLIAKLCYADLVCEVVKEFPELQGAMGGIYARYDGLDERVALGLEEFYFPIAAKTPVPTTNEGAIVSLAGKLDSLAGCFASGLEPTGSADPYALRRQAVGALRIILEKQLPLNLEAAVSHALELQPVVSSSGQISRISRQLCEFLWGRAQSFFEEMGYKIDEIRSVRPEGLKDLPRTFLRLSAVHVVRREPDFEALSAAFKRASNILKQAKVQPGQDSELKRDLLKDDAEVSLYDNLQHLEGEVHEEILNHGYEKGLRTLVSIKPHLDLFFDKVLVMAEEPELRRQRLGILSNLVRLFNSVADLSEIQQGADSAA